MVCDLLESILRDDKCLMEGVSGTRMNVILGDSVIPTWILIVVRDVVLLVIAYIMVSPVLGLVFQRPLVASHVNFGNAMAGPINSCTDMV